jgi:hypothetical protein
MRKNIIKNKNGETLLYIPCPKCASSSICSMLLNEQGIKYIDGDKCPKYKTYRIFDLIRGSFLIKLKLSIFFLKLYRKLFGIEQKWPGSVFKRIFGILKVKDINDKSIYNYRFCIVRDPVERFRSAFVSRIMFHKDILVPRNLFIANQLNLKAEPSLEEFLNDFDKYKKIPDILRHFMSQVDYYGDDPDFFTDIFSIKDLPKIAVFLSNFFGNEVKLLNKQRTKLDELKISEKELKIIKELYKDDYKVYGSYI